jgi:hypothetical protein
MAPINNKNKTNLNTKPDRLSKKELAADYGYATDVIYSNPEIAALFEKAVKQLWLPNRFKAALQNSNWYKNNSEYARETFVKKAMGGADWEESLKTARQQVQQVAVQMGSNLTPEQLNSLAYRFLNEGWDRPGREGLMSKALSENIGMSDTGMMRGASGNMADELRSLAEDNGITFSNDFYLSAAKSVNGQLSTIDDWARDIREQAASLFPVYSDKIRAGVSVRALASPYTTLMAQTFELDPNGISLNDPYIREALGGFSDTGDPKATNLWDFQKKLRNDPRWMNTLQANNEITNSFEGVLQMFGIRG